jgi:hypothetical protein
MNGLVYQDITDASTVQHLPPERTQAPFCPELSSGVRPRAGGDHGDAGGVRGEAPQRRAPPPRPHHQPRPRLRPLPALPLPPQPHRQLRTCSPIPAPSCPPPSPDSFVYLALCSDRLSVLFSCSAAQGEGDWAITSVLHDATSVVTRFRPLALLTFLPACPRSV